jgi:hypothetical protein
MNAFTSLDYAVVAVYVVTALSIGMYHARREQKSVTEYFVAGRSARTWAVVVSAIASGLSAISYLGAPAWVFQHDLQLNVSVFLLPLIILIVVRLFVPLFARHNLLTIFEYLEMRFNVLVRSVASALFLFLRGGWLATAIYAQSLVLSELAGIRMWVCAVFVGALTASYTVLGGLKAVLWTQVVQFVVLICGLLAIILTVLLAFGGDAGEIWRLAAAGGHTRWINPQFSFVQITAWAVVASTIVDYLATYGSNQVMVQRFLSARSPRADAVGGAVYRAGDGARRRAVDDRRASAGGILREASATSGFTGEPRPSGPALHRPRASIRCRRIGRREHFCGNDVCAFSRVQFAGHRDRRRFRPPLPARWSPNRHGRGDAGEVDHGWVGRRDDCSGPAGCASRDDRRDLWQDERILFRHDPRCVPRRHSLSSRRERGSLGGAWDRDRLHRVGVYNPRVMALVWTGRMWCNTDHGLPGIRDSWDKDRGQSRTRMR